MKLDWTLGVFYKTVMSDLSDLKDVYYDILAFFSPTGIKSLFKNFPDFKQNDTRIAVFGATTKKEAIRLWITSRYFCSITRNTFYDRCS